MVTTCLHWEWNYTLCVWEMRKKISFVVKTQLSCFGAFWDTEDNIFIPRKDVCSSFTLFLMVGFITGHWVSFTTSWDWCRDGRGVMLRCLLTVAVPWWSWCPVAGSHLAFLHRPAVFHPPIGHGFCFSLAPQGDYILVRIWQWFGGWGHFCSWSQCLSPIMCSVSFWSFHCTNRALWNSISIPSVCICIRKKEY